MSTVTSADKQENPIIAFVKEGKSLASPEGEELITKSDGTVIKEAAHDKQTFLQLIECMNYTGDVYVKRALILHL